MILHDDFDEDGMRREAARRGIIPPQPTTLRRYGLTVLEWLALLAGQGWRCPVCEKRTGVRWVTDHEHVPAWKAKPPEERKRYVRGVLCSFDNHRRVHSRISAAESQRITDYLATYEARRDQHAK